MRRRASSRLVAGIAVALAAIGVAVVVTVAGSDEPDQSSAGIVVPPPGTTEETVPSRTPVQIPVQQPSVGQPSVGQPSVGQPSVGAPPAPQQPPRRTESATGSPQHQFAPSVSFRIVNRVNSLVLDSGGNVGPGTPMKLWKAGSSSTNLQFQLIETGAGYYRLTNRTNGLSVDGKGLTAEGSPVGQRVFDGAPAMQWLPVETTPGLFLLKNRLTGLVLNGTGPDADSGDRAEQWPEGDSPNLLWRIVPV